MDHLEAAERIQAAVVGPGKLSGIEADRSPTGIELRRHLETCSECRSELRAWRLVDAALAEGTPDDLRAPAEARGRILDTVVASGVLRVHAARTQSTVRLVQVEAPAGTGTGAETLDAAHAAGPVSTTSTGLTFRRSSLAAAAVVALFVAGALLGGPLGSAWVNSDTSAELANAIVYTAGVLEKPGHVVAALQTPTGAPGGAVALAPESGDLVVVSGALTPPSDGQRYVCYLERDGQRTEVGSMWFVGTSAYWTGEISNPADAGRPGDRFIVQLEGSPGAALTATF